MKSLWLHHRLAIVVSLVAICGAAVIVALLATEHSQRKGSKAHGPLTSTLKHGTGTTARGIRTGTRSRRAGTVVFSGDWESGNISQWGTAQCANVRFTPGPFARGNINIVKEPEPVAQGRYAARFDLPPGSPASACEVLRVGRTEALGTDDWYAVEVYFPSNW